MIESLIPAYEIRITAIRWHFEQKDPKNSHTKRLRLAVPLSIVQRGHWNFLS